MEDTAEALTAAFRTPEYSSISQSSVQCILREAVHVLLDHRLGEANNINKTINKVSFEPASFICSNNVSLLTLFLDFRLRCIVPQSSHHVKPRFLHSFRYSKLRSNHQIR